MIFSSRKTHRGEKRTLRLINQKAPFAFVEAYNSLRTNIDYLAATNHYKTFLITSSGPWDGKSTVSINLAVSMASSGKRVILIDGDFRKASVASYLRINRSAPGITNVITQKKPLQEVIVHRQDLNLDVLPVGALPSNPSELVGAPLLANILQVLSEMYDYVIIDSPPVSVVTDAAILSRMVDGVILVARADETTKQALAASKKNLEDVNANILGVVLNDYDPRVHAYGGYYRGYYSGYKYGYKYGYGNESKKEKRKKREKRKEAQ